MEIIMAAFAIPAAGVVLMLILATFTKEKTHGKRHRRAADIRNRDDLA